MLRDVNVLAVRPLRHRPGIAPGIRLVTDRRTTILAYGLASCFGAFMVWLLLPMAAITGEGAFWTAPAGDVAQNLTGHLALQSSPWAIPPLRAATLMPPHGISVAMTDSNSLFSLLAKLVHTVSGSPTPINLLGIFLALCWLLQPVAAVYAVLGFDPNARLEARAAAAILGSILPALLFRIGHVNLCAHAVILMALGLAARRCLEPRSEDWRGPALIMTAGILIHPYLYVFAGVLLAAPWLQSLFDGSHGRLRALGFLCLSGGIPALLLLALSGTLGGGGGAYGHYSMNLLSPVWPAYGSLFGRAPPMMDATGGQYEGYNYLGAGGLLLIAVAFGTRLFRGGTHRPRRGLQAVLVFLFLISLTSSVYLGHTLILSFGPWPWNQIFGAIQAAGRAFWPVGYALILGSVSIVSARLPRPVATAILALACALQWADTAALRTNAMRFYSGAGEQRTPPIAIPPNVRLLTVVPPCPVAPDMAFQADALRLAAARAGIALSNMRISRLPAWFNCDRLQSDAMELPLEDGEFRVFLDPSASPPPNVALLGPEAVCRSRPELMACGAHVGIPDGHPVDPGPPPPLVPGDVGPEGLVPLLGAGWRVDGGGAIWSEGTRATLVFRLPPGATGFRLTVIGISRTPGRPHSVSLTEDAGPARTVDLPDMAPATIDIRPAPESDGWVRAAFDTDHPVPPERRGLRLPVHRASLQLLAGQVIPR